MVLTCWGSSGNGRMNPFVLTVTAPCFIHLAPLNSAALINSALSLSFPPLRLPVSLSSWSAQHLFWHNFNQQTHSSGLLEWPESIMAKRIFKVEGLLWRACPSVLKSRVGSHSASSARNAVLLMKRKQTARFQHVACCEVLSPCSKREWNKLWQTFEVYHRVFVCKLSLSGAVLAYE